MLIKSPSQKVISGVYASKIGQIKSHYMDAQKKELVKKVSSKNLNKAEKNSLISSIESCTEWGNETINYMKTVDAPPSLIYQFVQALGKVGWNVISFRETLRYRFMIALTIQQTWKQGIGEILTRTNFIKCKNLKTAHKSFSDPYITALNVLQNKEPTFETRGISKNDNSSGSMRSDILVCRQIGSLISSNEFANIEWIAVYRYGTNSMIASFTKPKQKIEFCKFYACFSGSVISFCDLAPIGEKPKQKAETQHSIFPDFDQIDVADLNIEEENVFFEI